MSDDIQYPDHFVERLHTVWGERFLSPGWLKVRKSLADAVAAGGLRPTHLKGFKPND